MTITADTVKKHFEVANKLQLKFTGMAEAVAMFMIAFNQELIHDDQLISDEDFQLATRLMREEMDEMWEGLDKFYKARTLENKTEFVDGAIDSIYVILWSLLKFGVPVDKCFDEVQRSNMAKLQPDGSYLKNGHGKVQKPDGWTPPDLFGILKEHQATGLYRNGWRNHEAEIKETAYQKRKAQDNEPK